jgi:hypothetical protein
MKQITKKELSEIRQIAHKILMNRGGSIYSPVDRDLILIEAILEWLYRNGVPCEWRVDE